MLSLEVGWGLNYNINSYLWCRQIFKTSPDTESNNSQCIGMRRLPEKLIARMPYRVLENQKGGNSKRGVEPLTCSACKQELPSTSFTNTQARKPDSSRKCRGCSAAAEAAEAEASRIARQAKMGEAQAASAAAAKLPKGSAGAAARLKAASAECAREAEQVTGLKPLIGAGKRGGRGRGRGTWRGRASSGRGSSARGRGGDGATT